jgi:hypothetical protein
VGKKEEKSGADGVLSGSADGAASLTFQEALKRASSCVQPGRWWRDTQHNT